MSIKRIPPRSAGNSNGTLNTGREGSQSGNGGLNGGVAQTRYADPNKAILGGQQKNTPPRKPSR
jgi:hypothetical protein